MTNTDKSAMYNNTRSEIAHHNIIPLRSFTGSSNQSDNPLKTSISIE